MADQSSGHAGDRTSIDDCRRTVCAFFSGSAAAAALIEPVSGGQSGSAVYRVRLPDGSTWAVKSLPERLDGQRGRWVHRLMQHLGQELPQLIPMLASTSTGETLWRDLSGQCWEMASWMPGEPLAAAAATEVASAMQTLAAVHARAAAWQGKCSRFDVPPAAVERSHRARALLERPWAPLLAAVAAASARPPRAAGEERPGDAELAAWFDAARRLFEQRGGPPLQRLARWQPGPTRLHAVLRDLTPEHLLWSGHRESRLQVSGLIDFHAARVDTPACDLARLLAGWGLGLPQAPGHAAALDAYVDAANKVMSRSAGVATDAMHIESATTQLRRLVPILAAAGVVLGLDNWLRWLFEEQRRFADFAAVRQRIESLTADLEPALFTLESLQGDAR